MFHPLHFHYSGTKGKNQKTFPRAVFSVESSGEIVASFPCKFCDQDFAFLAAVIAFVAAEVRKAGKLFVGNQMLLCSVYMKCM